MLSLSSQQSRISFLFGLWLGPFGCDCHGFTGHNNCAGIVRDWRESGGNGGPQGFQVAENPLEGQEQRSRAEAVGQGQ